MNGRPWLFKWRQFEAEIIVCTVRWYLRYSLSYREVQELLAERGINVVEVPDEEFETMGANVLALAPRVALALDGNDETRRRMERAGVDVRVYRGEEISLKGDGGPTCLTRPLLRAT